MMGLVLHFIITSLCCLGICENASAILVTCPKVSAIWWPKNPYVFRQNGKVLGILPALFDAAGQYCCENGLHINWSETFPDYKSALRSIETSVPKSAVMNNSDVKIWLPFSLLHLPESSRKKNISILTTGHLIIFASETASDKLTYVYNGFKGIFPLVLITLFLTILFGIFIWVAETSSNESQFPKPFFRGAWHGFWWAIVTITTVGYGDKHPRTGSGKLIGIFWMVLGLVLLPCLTAELTSLLTNSTYSLTMKHVGVLKNTEVVKKMSEAGAVVRECESYQHCLEMLEKKDINAMATDPYVAKHLGDSYSSLVVKATISAAISTDIVLQDQEERLNGLLKCIHRNSSMTTRSVMTSRDMDPLETATGSFLSNAGMQVVAIVIGCVAFIYCCVLIGDAIMRWHRKKRSIGDFRSGVFMEKGTIKFGSDIEMKDVQTSNKSIRQLIEIQRKQLLNIQIALDEMERQMPSYSNS